MRLLLLLLVLALPIQAATYTMASNSRPPCSTSWSVSGTTYTCTGNGRITLNNNDVIAASANAITLVAANGFRLGSRVTLGGNSNKVNLQATYGTVEISANSIIWGSVQTSSGAITVNSATLQGSVQTNSTYNHNGGVVNGNINATNGVVLTSVTVSGTVTANSDVNLTGSSIAGKVTSSSNKVTATNSTLQNGVSGSSGVQISGGTLSGDIQSVCNNVVLNNITMLSGDIKTTPELGTGCGADRVEIVGGSITANIVGGANNVVIRDGAEFNGNIQARYNVLLNGSTVRGDIIGEDGYVLQETRLINAEVYGSVTVGTSWQRIVGEGNSAIYGQCTYGAITPATLCSQQPVQCLADDFNTASLTDSWVTARSSGNFTPSVVDSRLRLTQAVANQSTSATFQRLYPAANNLLIIEFDYYAWSSQSGTGADGVAVILSDANVAPQPGAFGGSLGYAQKGAGTDCPNCAGFAGGWLGIALDEYGNFSNPTEGRNGGPGFRPQSVSVRGAAAGNYQYLTGTAANLNPRIDVRSTSTAAPGHRYRITIDSRQADQALVSVQRDSGSGFTTLIAPFNALAFNGQSPVPENFFLSFTGSTGGSNNNHELDNLSICALRSEPVGVLIDHFQLSHPAEMVSCLAAPVQIKACLNERCLDGADIYTDPVAVTLSADGNANWVGGNTITLSNGIGTAYLRNPVIGANPQVSIDAVSSVPAAKAFFRERNRCLTGPDGTSCEVRFVDSGILFTAPDGELPLDHQTAGVGFSGVLRAIKTDPDDLSCEARIKDPQPVELGFSCENPGTCISGQQFSVNDTAIAANDAGTVVSRTTLMLNFDTTGSALLTMNYSDVGQLRLHARLTLPEQLPDPAITLQTSSNAFVVRPHTLAVVQATRADGSANPGTTNTGDGFIAAGEPFNVVIEAQNAHGAATPNFGREMSRQLVQPAFSMLEYPADGSDGILSAGVININQPAQNGRQTVTDASWNEAGSIRLHAKLNNDSYLGVADVSAKPVSGIIGRFYPNMFRLESSSVLNSCRLHADVNNHFSYMSEDKLTVNYKLLATGFAGNTLLNYHSDVYTDTAEMLVVAENNLIRLDAARLAINTAKWEYGVYTVAQTDAAFKRATTPDGPYAALQLGLQILSGSERDNRNFSAFTLGTDAVALNAAEEPLRVRFGRMVLDNAYGPENENLPLVARAEYWNGAAFVTNPQDNCSPLNDSLIVSPITFNPQDSGSTTITADSNPLWPNVNQGSSVINGASQLWLNEPDPVLRGTGNVEYQLNDHPWLQYDWDADGGFDENPTAEFMFGRFRGNPRQIYWLELFQ